MANMTYQCIYCKAQYAHAESYKHNAYQCPKRKGVRMKAGLVGLLVVSLVGLTGCEMLKDLLPKDRFPNDVNKVELAIYSKDKVYKYECVLNTDTKALTDCREVQ